MMRNPSTNIAASVNIKTQLNQTIDREPDYILI